MKLTDRDIKILMMKAFDTPVSEIGKEFGVTPGRIYQKLRVFKKKAELERLWGGLDARVINVLVKAGFSSLKNVRELSTVDEILKLHDIGIGTIIRIFDPIEGIKLCKSQ
jgi:hypothetical protein